MFRATINARDHYIIDELTKYFKADINVKESNEIVVRFIVEGDTQVFILKNYGIVRVYFYDERNEIQYPIDKFESITQLF